MDFILLTQDTGLLKPIVLVLGKIMDIIFNAIDAIGIPNVGLAIILFTIIVNLLMMPLTIKQQKFSKLSSKVQPEIQAIQAKYKNKKDNDSMMAQNMEIQQVYAKYGISPSGSCMYLLIQMPILFSLYRVIYSMPAYVSKIGDAYRALASKIIATDGAAFIQNSEVESIKKVVSMYGRSMTEGNMENGVVDVINKLSSTDLAAVAEHYGLNGIELNGQLILSNETTKGLLDTYNNFLGLNMGDSPWNIMQEAFASGAWLLLIGALMIPILSAVTQWINYKLMPQANNSSDNKSEMASSMEASMKSMNTIMPIMSAWLCFTFASGMGIYWIAGSVFRGIQQVIINKHFDKVDFEEIINKNKEKSAKKIEKLKEQQERMSAYANMNTRSIQNKANIGNYSSDSSNSNNSSSGSSVNYSTNAKPGSMMAKANMVKEYNERNNK